MTNLLIIDDSPKDREWLAAMACQSGDVTVHTVSSGAAGLQYVREHGADCVLLDYRLEGKDGLAILPGLKSNIHCAPVIVMTGQGNEDQQNAAINAGASGCLIKKDLTAQKLSETVASVVGDRRAERTKAKVPPKRVLLVEDNDDDREAIAEMIAITDARAVVHAVATGTQALADFDANGADCVILDYRLEIEDGLDVLRLLKERSPFTPVIMLTGQGNEEVAARSIKVGAADYLVKQRLNVIYLRTAIDNAISRAALEAKVADQEVQRRQFLNTLVHDLRAPLRQVRQLGDIAVEEADNGDMGGMKDALASLRKLSSRATDLIATLESYALLDGEIAFAPVSLTMVAEAARDNLATVIFDRQAEVVIRDMPNVIGHAPQLTQLLQNLISNGLKYNQNPQPQIVIESEGESNDGCCIVVRDNGIGIPAKHLGSIFAPLNRLWSSDQYEGTGLGLAICQKIVERHDGKIWCTSVEGKGSQFHIQFPVAGSA